LTDHEFTDGRLELEEIQLRPARRKRAYFPAGSIGAPGKMEARATTEADLIARILSGEKELFHELIRPYERMVYLTVFSVVKNETEAEDGAQDAVINAYRHLASFRGDAKFSTWLVTIAINEGRQRLRKAKGVAERSIDEVQTGEDGEYTPAPLTDWREIPSEALERKELREALRTAVEELPSIYRQVFTLRDLEEMSIDETSQALGINVGVVKVRLHRARIMMQKRLAPFLKTTAPARKGFLRRIFL
jgi:RNA polymerase sigma-70 factor (ECF subfamily)